jgi:hypothetical protein
MSETVMMRIRKDIHDALRDMARQENASMQEVMSQALEAYRRTRLFQRADTAYAALKAKPAAWQEEMEERAMWDAASR